MKMSNIYSEIFMSMQGEGKKTGTPGPWVRFFGCNFNCDGFGQDDPSDPTTYKLPYKDIDITNIDMVEDLPIFEYGCDSSYSWSKKFKHLMCTDTSEGMAKEVIKVMSNQYNPKGLFKHPVSKVSQHLHFTGGEPLLKRNQKIIVEMMEYLISIDNYPKYITIETNGTQILTEQFKDFWNSQESRANHKLFFSVSPKLFNVSGEMYGFRPEVVKSYMLNMYDAYPNDRITGQLKFVVNNSEECWKELQSKVDIVNSTILEEWPVYLMPVGATKEQQEDVSDLADKIVANGYNLSARVHCYIWGNKIGT